MLMKKGAEASLFLADWHGRRVILKKRLRKKYRPLQLDEQIRTYRTVHEPQLMHRAKEAGVPTPTIFKVDTEKSTIIMEFIEGKQVKQVLDGLQKQRSLGICRHIGELIGRLHRQGIIHGDLTTSNMIVTPFDKVYFVDFGLGEYSSELEIRGVDLHLMKRALGSTHFKFAEESFKAVSKGYSKTMGKEAAETVFAKVKEIERRGRYVAEREKD